MPCGWKDCAIAEVASSARNALVGGPFGSNLISKDYVATGTPVIRGQNMGERWIGGEFVFVSDEKAGELSANTARPGDLVFTQRGTLGQVAIVPTQPYDRYIVSQSQMKLTVDSGQADTLFLYYYFHSPEQQDYIIRNAVQVGVPHTNLEHLRTTPLCLPPLLEQRAIAEVLGALDDKIELNRRMNKTLEKMAQAVFREWLISGKQAGSWTTGKLGEIAAIVRRATRPDELPCDTPYIGLEHMPRGSIALGEWGNASEVTSNKFSFREGEFLFGKLRPYFHKVGVAPVDGVSSTDILVIAPREHDYYGAVLGHISSPELIEFTTAASTGTKMPRTSWDDIARYEIPLPPRDAARQFTEFIKPVIALIRANLLQSRTLAALRGTLLPKLMSGEVRVKL